MKTALTTLICAAIVGTAAHAADTAAPSVGKIYDRQLASLERELVPLAEAMPAAKYDFAPTQGEFKGVRTFALQARHIAYVLYEVSGALGGEKNPSKTVENENGPGDLKTKDQIVQYLKDAFAFSHKAMATLTNANELEMVESPFGDGKIPRVTLASINIWHSYDHYGQMVVYARMNGVIPPASRR